ncbi:Na(+)-translocating NADH-quinone reductase subunit A [Alkalisalibacterium limincola]|uniref:Na(+)-translocating NADH-quinone reductase subunit A n=1 Tax=Alkalisalibacterium limincola TaxID=2699169 RepID=A0A5C8KZC8_9GAMM|nr:Na(+)-translocating NADH-quinone reductase subunit A [Alkalisalibacterium limincola]TXK64977.1 Na(+)-translocating NADH-quinone reductase subunit A [Alkalisalibacterium limincola]
MIRIKRGLDLPIDGAPRQEITDGPRVRSVATLGADYPGMRPTLHVKPGDRVSRGQLIFEDKKTPGVRYTAPAAGTVTAVNRGRKRFMQSVVIEIDGDAEQSFENRVDGLSGLDRDKVQALLVESGEWTALRTRPFGKVPAPGSAPHAIFVPAIDTQPLAPDPDVVIGDQLDAFRDGLEVLGHLTDGTVWVCRADGSELPSFARGRIREEAFAGPHPAGNPSTHIHFLSPVDAKRTAWVMGYQDVIAVGHLFRTGRLYSDRVVALAGPQVEQPRLLRTRVGACLDELTAGQMKGGENRIISGSVFNGHQAEGPTGYLGRLANQVSVLREGNDRPMFGYLSPGLERHSVLNIYLSKLMPWKRFGFTTTTNGSERAMVPLGQYETVMPLDILPTQLLRSLVVGDTEMAQALGALELVEEDLALCTYVCVGKYEYGPILRDNLDRIEKEG